MTVAYYLYKREDGGAELTAFGTVGSVHVNSYQEFTSGAMVFNKKLTELETGFYSLDGKLLSELPAD